jgi:NAD(P)H-flavin reductase
MSTTLNLARPEPMCGMDTWLPVPARIQSVVSENFNTHTFALSITDKDLAASYRWQPGQFNMLYLPGVGEAAISISSDSEEPQTLLHTIRIAGSVTRGLHRLGPGGLVGLRGPFGRGWPLAELEDRDVLMVAGGIGLAPLRPVIYWLLRHRDFCRRIILLYGSRSPDDCLYAHELKLWHGTRASTCW